MLGRSRAAGSAFRRATLWLSLLAMAGILAGLTCDRADASIRRHHWQATRQAVRLTDPDKDAALIVDGETGNVLYERNADALRHPASLTKMMTLYLLFEQLKSGQMTLATPLCASEHAAIQQPTKLNLRPGTCIPVDTAIKAIVVLSANDVAVVIAEAIGGSEEHFAELMTAKARALGMTHTFYHNASGLPDPMQITSAADLTILARHLAYDFPQYFHYFSTYSFSYHGMTHFTHDNLIGRYEGADGIKTGYTGASGFNLVSSVVRNGVHIIGVVMGGITARRRDTEMTRLLDDTFAEIGRNPQLVARENVPWQTLADNSQTKPVIAGFQFENSEKAAPEGGAQVLRPAPAQMSDDDEEAAESRPDPAYDAPAPPARSLALPPPAASVRALPGGAQPVVMASLGPSTGAASQIANSPAPHNRTTAQAPIMRLLRGRIPLPEPKPSMALAALDPLNGGIVVPKPRMAPVGHDRFGSPVETAASGFSRLPISGTWTIQIGAYADEATAKAELASYAEQSMDILGEAARIVAPFQSAEGHVLYRARFGPFAEQKAREVCETLTRRGQTCFAALASR